MRRLAILNLALSLWSSPANGEVPLVSGPQPGDKVGYLDFRAVKCGGPQNRFKVDTKYRYY